MSFLNKEYLNFDFNGYGYSLYYIDIKNKKTTIIFKILHLIKLSIICIKNLQFVKQYFYNQRLNFQLKYMM